MSQAFAAERERWILWIPVIFGCGIGGYFALPAEPPAAVAPFGLLFCAACYLVGRTRLRFCAVITFVLISGLGAAQWRSLMVAAPILADEIRAQSLSGSVLRVEPQEGEAIRLVLSDLTIRGVPADNVPDRARLTVRTAHKDVRAGDFITVRATLSPPPEPVAPFAYDFARAAWFERIGAVGFAVGPVRVTGHGRVNEIGTKIEILRRVVSTDVITRIGGGEGAIAAALLTGVRGSIADSDAEAMRIAGLAHLLAISGLHIGLVTATAFFALRALLALWPALALRYDMKKIAAMGAWAVAFFYFLLSGATVPTQRAFLMVSVMLLALLLGRQPLSLRLVAFSALVILILTPEALLSASFHMSFGAVTVLVVVYRSLSPRLATWRREAGPVRRIALYFLSVVLTTLIAEFAIAPFAAFHFNQITSYGLLANLIAVPLMAMWIMPTGLLALILMPIGLEAYALDLMGLGVFIMLRTAHQVASLPGAHFVVPSFPVAALVMASLGSLWLLVWRRFLLRSLAIPIVAGAVFILAQSRPPDLLVSRKADLFGVLSDEGFAVSSMTKARYSREQWTRLVGEREAVLWNKASGQSPPVARCDAFGCLVTIGAHRIGFAQSPEALAQDCRHVGIVVAAIPIRQACPLPSYRIDRFDVWRNGAYALWFDEGSNRVKLRSVRDVRGARPWVVDVAYDGEDEESQ